MWTDDLTQLFPLTSQTSREDRHWLAQLFRFVRDRHSPYRYLEVGSFLGGTLTPALLDERCCEAVSIDLRPKVQADARQADFDYSHTSTQTMLDGLRLVPSLDLQKLRTFDGRAGEFEFGDARFHFAFIDAEHTDEAVFADYLAVSDHLHEDAVCAFHDDYLVSAGLENIRALLVHQRRAHRMLAFAGSMTAALILENAVERIPAEWLGQTLPWDQFLRASKDKVLMSAIENRLTFQLALKPRPVRPMDGGAANPR